MTRISKLALMALPALAFASPVFAQSADWLRDGRPAYTVEQRQSYYDSRRVAYDAGFREGLKEGEKDGKRGDRFEYRDEKSYQRADKGFHREFGDIDRYRQVFRSGYVDGYGEAYRRFARNVSRNDGWDRRGPDWSRGPISPSQGPRPGYGGYYSPAFQNGVDDGYEKGVEDARKRRTFDPLRHEWYREGDRHYEGRYGPRQQYKDTYREGFRSGYERGFRGGVYR
jgi:hypothetical protein